MLPTLCPTTSSSLPYPHTPLLIILLMMTPLLAHAQTSPLTVDQIMQDPATWVGDWPTDLHWADDGVLYFRWNPQGAADSDSLYKVIEGRPVNLTRAERQQRAPRFVGWQHGTHVYDADQQRRVYDEGGDLFLYDRRTKTRTQLTDTRARESRPRFTPDGTAVIFTQDDNLFRLALGTGRLAQLTDLRSGSERKDDQPDEQDALLEAQQQDLFETLRERRRRSEARDAAQQRDEQPTPPTYYYGSKRVQQLQLDPTGRYVTFSLGQAGPRKPTSVQAYITESGYAEELTARPKVGVPGGTQAFFVQDLQQDTTFEVNLHQLPGSYDVVPVHRTEEGVDVDSTKGRSLSAYGPYWSGDGRFAVLDVRTRDNKTRWLARLDPQTGDLTVLDRQQDDAWIAGPGISWWGGASTVGWLPDHQHFYFLSERTGYSNLYTANLRTGEVKPVATGTFEVTDVDLSKDGRTWLLTTSEGSPYERHLYRQPVDDTRRTRLTTQAGMNTIAVSPGGETLGVLHSKTTQPPEVFVQAPRATPRRVTHSPAEAWQAYPWRSGEIVEIPASDGAQVPAQLFRPENPNGAAVLFVHGAGYLQNVHRGWSGYFREYMFHNLLTDLGYTVLNVDFRASAGYGRDWRTAIYRHMGGRDLQDYVDASQYVGRQFGIPSERVFIYGGSYGGFITLMALFTEAEHFGGGAALRSVTDWAHYNHTYTANILNTPAEDSLAFRRSSPIYFAEGLEDPLLIAHGMVDTNVQFQDVVRLAQRLIELRKDDWEMALYPVEGHGFTEPTSWADEYRRILDYIERSVGPEREE